MPGERWERAFDARVAEIERLAGSELGGEVSDGRGCSPGAVEEGKVRDVVGASF